MLSTELALTKTTRGSSLQRPRDLLAGLTVISTLQCTGRGRQYAREWKQMEQRFCGEDKVMQERDERSDLLDPTLTTVYDPTRLRKLDMAVPCMSVHLGLPNTIY